MTDIEPTDRSTGRRRCFVRAIVPVQATIAVTFVFGATALSRSFSRRQDIWLRLDRSRAAAENHGE